MTLTPDRSLNTNNFVPFKGHLNTLYCVLTRCPDMRAELQYLTIDLLGNIVVFIPFGFSLAGLFYQPERKLLANTVPALLGGAGLSLFAESVQLGMATRAGDITDVVWNSVGAVLGALFLHLLQKGVTRKE
jgi:glycopeptide antibiotics resistance protein